MRSPSAVCALLLAVLIASTPVARAETGTSDELVGLWKAQRWYGPYARGPLLLQKTAAGWSADFNGSRWPVRATGKELQFELSDEQGSFRGQLRPDGRIAGHWTSPNSLTNGSKYASPLLLERSGLDLWRGDVEPRNDQFTLYLMLQKRADGSIGAFLRNPERNIGVFYDLDRLERTGSDVRLIGHRLGSKKEETLLSGTYDAEQKILSIGFNSRGGTYDFRPDTDDSYFYPRGKNPGRYAYQVPPARNDAWPTATLEDVGIDRPAIERFIQVLLDMPMDTVHAPEVEGILVARHGKLVLEEYFHGEHRDKFHETRSAAKSLTATMVGAVMEAGAPLALSTPVYQVMYAGQELPADLDPRKRAMTLENLLSMSSGYFCDDNNPQAPGNEDSMLDQSEEPDYYRYTLRVPMDSAPGEKTVYCSINPNLALGVVNRATGESVLDTFDRLLGTPLRIATYAWPLDPAGHPYGGGGAQFLPRDFMKLGQLMLNDGTWQGRRILGKDFVKRASAPARELNNIQYGYLWWSIQYPYKNRTVRAFFAGGNGGQAVMVLPELDLVIATYGGNYADRVSLRIQQDFVPNYVLPAVREAGDDPNRPVVQGAFTTPYGRH
ncbi:MAG TPA: serine hydrolase [Steroidobacteraceae bacterium]|nr:serine hydrolase [Steroidobacteraceae bacterium]